MTTFYSDEIDSSSAISRSTTSIVTGFTAGYSTIPISVIGTGSAVKSVSSGVLTANTLATVLNITGTAGNLWQLAYRNVDVTARTVRVKITVDSVVILDVTSASSATSGQGAYFAGFASTENTIAVPPISFKSSCLIEVASSLTETNKTTFYLGYNTEA